MRWLLALLIPAAVFAADPAYTSAEAKLDRIGDRQAKPGEVIVFTPQEVNAWARVAVPDAVPQGVRNPRVELGMDTGTGYALVDFLKMRKQPSSWLVTKMIEGERPLKIVVTVVSGGGRCKVMLNRVEIGGVAAEGQVLDFLVKNFFLPLYPDAKINEPFDLDYNIDRIDLRPTGIRVTMKR